MLPPQRPPQKHPIYHVTFEDYLQPRKPHKSKKLQFCASKAPNGKPDMRLKLLEHPALIAERPSKWRTFCEKFKKKLFPLKKEIKTEAVKVSIETHSKDPESDLVISQELNKVAEFARRWQLRTKFKSLRKLSRFRKFPQLPNFLAFLRARNDDGLCKRKTGFEIYCEMASIHGFVNFVGATTWQRVFWCLVISLAMLMSTIILVMSNLMNIDTPTILYIESTTYPAWTIPFPAITICNMNRISRKRAERRADQFHSHSTRSQREIIQQLPLSLYTTDRLKASPVDYRFLQTLLDRSNYTLAKLQHEISPNCEMELLRCKWKGRIERCDHLFQKVETPQGICCSFNYHALKHNPNKNKLGRSFFDHPEHIASCGYKMGLTVLLDPHLSDYMASTAITPGFQVLIHDAYDYPDQAVERLFIQPRTETTISITPRQTYATDYIKGEKLHSRRCYFPNERQLNNFSSYSHTNCLAECRSKLIFEKCACVPSLWPRIPKWPVCRLEQSECILTNRDIFTQLLKESKNLYKINHYSENFICDCFPLCSFNQYSGIVDSGILDRNFSFGDRRFFKNIKVDNHILLHVFYDDLIAERLRMDVYENWLSFVGTFGGITGLHMGYSFVSGFEMIFFVFVRPACNWLTKKQIRYRIRRRQKKAAAAAAKKEQEEKAKKKQQEVEAGGTAATHVGQV